MKIINFHESENQGELIAKISQCDWSAAKFLAELLQTNTFLSRLGGEGELYILMDGNRLVSFATLTRQDSVCDERLFPWIGFVYTAPEYRGSRCAGRVLAHAEAAAAKRGHKCVYLATDHVGLYEKYGYEYLENRIDVWADENRVYCKNLRGTDGI